jgi:alpha,alpha-trehalase
MLSTVRGMIENFLLLLSNIGLVPNGGRIYYTKRSQPPFLTLMVKEYAAKDRDHGADFVKRNLQQLEAEIAFWEQHRSIQVEKNGKQINIITD